MIKHKTLCYKASAGTGKTFALTVRYISLLLAGAKAHEILALTFTNKAAIQMNQRIFKTLQTLGEDEAILGAISEETSLSSSQILEKKQELINSFLASETSIFTIDKFINKILREFSGYCSVSDSFQIDRDDMTKLGFDFLLSLDEKSFEQLLTFSHFSEKQYLSLLELFKLLIDKNEKIQPIHLEEGVIKSSKELVLVEALKLKSLIVDNDKAVDRVKKLFSYTTFDEVIKVSFIKYDSLYDHSWFKKVIDENIEAQYKVFRDALYQYFRLLSQYNLNQLKALFEKFVQFKETYNKKKNYLEFTDIANYVYRLLSTKTVQSDFLYFRLDAKYHHILIDEFQDTSLLQYKILKPLIDEVFAGEGSSFKTFFYVGDTKQSIYRFRGGKSDLFDYLKVDYPSLEVKHLNTNYRSKDQIVSYVNEIFLNIPSFDMVKQLSNKSGGYVEVIGVEKDFGKDKQFQEIADTIEKLLDNGLSPNEITILTYKNEDVLNILNFLQKSFPNLTISTDMTSKLINENNVKAIINFVKYLYFKEDIYKANFNALIDKNVQKEIELSINIKEKNLIETVHNIADFYSLFSENVIKFLEVIKSYEDIVDFIYNIDNQDSSMVNGSNQGIQILTVFKSKGLEFNTVLLLDRITKKNSDKSSILFEYDGIELKNIHYKMENKKYLDSDYKDALEKEEQLQRIDDLNVLYVALTRAENNLIVFKRDDKSSAFNLLDIVKKGKIVIENHSKEDRNCIKKQDYIPLRLGFQSQNNKPHQDEQVLQAQYFGIATHYCLEMMNEFTIESLQKAILLTRTRYSNFLEDNHFKAIFGLSKRLVENQTFQNLILNSRISKEQALTFNGEVKVLDLLVVNDEEVKVFDYKTTQEKQEEHFNQLNVYKEALKTIFDGRIVKGYIIYLNHDEIVEVK